MTNVHLNSYSEEVELSNIAKKPKTVELDRICGLPDELISHILSFLSTKDAVATSILSKRWRSLWTLVPVLEFYSSSSKENQSFLRFFRRRVRTLDRSLAKVRLQGKFGPYFGNWVTKIIASGVQEMDLCMTGAKPTKIFCHGSLTSKTLVSLRVKNVSFQVVVSAHLPCLKILHLQDVRDLSEESISQFIVGCPVIEDVFVSNYFQKIKLPLSLFTSQTLVSLNIGYGVSFDFPSFFHLPHIKILHLQTHEFVLDHEFISELLSECTLLEDLDIRISSYGEPIKIPEHLFVSKTLVSLKLYGKISLHVPPSVCLPNLRVLHLGGSILMLDKLLGDLLSGCPVLEEIDLRGLYTTNKESSSTCVLTVGSLLVTLGHRDQPFPLAYKLKIMAPALKHIRIFCGLHDNIAWNFTNLQEASVSFEPNIPKSVFGAVRNIEVLKLHQYTYTFGCNLPPLNIDLLPKFQHLNLLEIYNPLSFSYFLSKILENSPNLQVLMIVSKSDSPDVAWSTPRKVPYCLLHSLTTFGICHFRGLDKETQMVDYILSQGRVLETIVVGLSISDVEQELHAQEKISAIPRCSRMSQLKFI